MTEEKEEINIRETPPKKKEPTPYGERNPQGRPRGSKSILPRKPTVKFHAKRQRDFLKNYLRTGSVDGSAQAVGVSRGTVYFTLKKDANFREAFERVKNELVGKLEETMITRILEGEKTIVKDGEGNVITETIKPANASLALKVTSKYSEMYKDDDHTGSITEASNAINKLATALGLTVDEDAIAKKQRELAEKDIEGEVVGKG